MAGAIVYLLNGPNLNLLGTREPEVYGKQTLADIEAAAKKHAEKFGFGVDFRQSNPSEAITQLLQSHEMKCQRGGLSIAGCTHDCG